MGPAQIAALENCGIQVEDADGDIKFREFEFIDIIKPEPMTVPKTQNKWEDPLAEATRLPNYNKVGNIIDCYPGAKLWNYQVSKYEPGAPLLQVGGQKN
jgi:hypothetical protein